MTKPDGCRSATVKTSHGRCGHETSVEQRLGASGYLALRRIDCACEDGVLSLRGCVPTYYLKQVAQSIAGTVDGVRRVDNRIEVVTAEPKAT